MSGAKERPTIHFVFTVNSLATAVADGIRFLRRRRHRRRRVLPLTCAQPRLDHIRRFFPIHMRVKLAGVAEHREQLAPTPNTQWLGNACLPTSDIHIFVSQQTKTTAFWGSCDCRHHRIAPRTASHTSSIAVVSLMSHKTLANVTRPPNGTCAKW